MRFLLTSGGITNASIHDALVDLLGKPIAECSALCIPTAIYAFPGGAASAYRLITGSGRQPVVRIGLEVFWVFWSSLRCPASTRNIGSRWSGRLMPCWWEAATPSICATGCSNPDWQTSCRRCRATVYVGVSAGSLVIGPNVGEQFVYGNPLTGGDRALGMVDFSIFPHVDHEDMPDDSMANAEEWAAGISGAGYAIDDQTAIQSGRGAPSNSSPRGSGSCFPPAPKQANQARRQRRSPARA